MKVSAIVVAAGNGTRMRTDKKKPYMDIAGEPLLVRTLRAIESSPLVREIVLVVGEEDLNEAKLLVDQYGIRRVTRYAAGGIERQDSVRNGLEALDSAPDLVVVHDGARPFVTAEEMERVIQAAADCGAAIIGTPVKDTIKRVSNGLVQETIPRNDLYSVQTPQAFRTQLLREAHEKAARNGFRGTDDASLVEWTGHPVKIVEGSYRNIKITTPEDLVVAEAFLQKDR
ncbi:2-C-methyl-D-erythritol 4-phosphate cytidylyltransferase [Effusibacillus lacus]|uniref:2-C-methyl-D-erythritol 4-phosphate cytidylyltransferase n=1 Tax=Effusibacillus lacus TaxID=1348429 RepID=A0A292YG42_9BACL|nr:2-C-methyl-D-erythritol 4-phosphate cytidylyltransferase [Effusibacillus lacus]GAX89347.1 2-C-methyl-D-erythritol 4-phosphate cytidylyltransferase [Effusibacillus lacus]